MTHEIRLDVDPWGRWLAACLTCHSAWDLGAGTSEVLHGVMRHLHNTSTVVGPSVVRSLVITGESVLFDPLVD